MAPTQQATNQTVSQGKFCSLKIYYTDIITQEGGQTSPCPPPKKTHMTFLKKCVISLYEYPILSELTFHNSCCGIEADSK
jgi:hypothetical protein